MNLHIVTAVGQELAQCRGLRTDSDLFRIIVNSPDNDAHGDPVQIASGWIRIRNRRAAWRSSSLPHRPGILAARGRYRQNVTTAGTAAAETNVANCAANRLAPQGQGCVQS